MRKNLKNDVIPSLGGLEGISDKKKFSKGSILFHKGEASSKKLSFLLSGTVGLIEINPNGDESLLRVFGENDFIGYRSFLSGESFHATALALSDVELSLFSFKDMSELQRRSPELLLHLTRVLASDLKSAEERLIDVTGKRVLSRVIEALVFLKQRHPDYMWTRREIGDFCGTRTETVTRTLSFLEEAGLIHRNGREIHLLDTQELLEMSKAHELS